jgi:hypothetical protein
MGYPLPPISRKILHSDGLGCAIRFKIFIIKELSLKILFLNELAPAGGQGFPFL